MQGALAQGVGVPRLVAGVARRDLSDVGMPRVSGEHTRHKSAEVWATAEAVAGSIKRSCFRIAQDRHAAVVELAPAFGIDQRIADRAFGGRTRGLEHGTGLQRHG